MADNTTITLASNLTLTASGGTGITVQGDTITFCPVGTTTVVGVTLQGSGLGFLNSITLPSVNNVTFSPATVALSNGQYVFTCTNNVTGATPSTGSFMVTFTSGPGITNTAAAATFTHDPTMIFQPPG